MYSEMARAIADKTRAMLTEEETIRLSSARQVNPRAYEAYIQGRPHWHKMEPEELATALQHFETALQIDPNYASAHAGVAIVWALRGLFGFAPFSEARPLAMAAAEKALGLDDTLAEAHFADAFTKAWSDFNLEAGETAFRRALELNPNFPDAHAWYSHILSMLGRNDKALLHIERAIELDPFNALVHGMYGIILLYQRRFDEAIAAARTAQTMDPTLGMSRTTLQYCFILKGMRDEQLAIQRARIALDPERVTAFDRGLEEGGYEGAQRAIADLLASRYGKPGRWVYGASGIALRYLDAGDYDQTIDWLEKAYEEKSVNIFYLGLPLYDPLRSYPRFQDLLRRIGLPVDEKK
jgi:Tfp pilus assembly protein PilF